MVSGTTEQVFFFVVLSQELCLHAKLLASPNTSIADFLSKAAESPPFLVLRNAVALLKVCLDNQGFVYCDDCFFTHFRTCITCTSII